MPNSSRRKSASPPDTCVIYTRISLDRTGESLGVQRQLADCRALAAKLGMKVTRVYSDNDISATNGKVRPAFEEMLASRPAAIVAWHQDRLLRLTKDLERVIDLECNAYFVTAGDVDLSTPSGRAVARTLVAWATYEGEQKGLRQQAANVQRAQMGHWQFSRRPYGYRRAGQGKERRIEVVPDEADIIRELFQRYVAGETYYALAADLNARDVPTFENTPWSMARVRQLLRNPRYAGIVESNGTRYDDATPSWEPIIDRALWNQAEDMRDDRTRPGAWSTSTKYLLSGLAICGVCGGRMLARPDHGKLSYACGANWCTSRSLAGVDELVVEVVLARLKDPSVIRRLRERPDSGPLLAELDDLRHRRDDIAELVADGLLDGVNARRRAQDLTSRINALEERLSALRAKSPTTDIALVKSIPRRWKKLSVLDKRRILSELGVTVTIHKTKPGRYPFDPNSVSIGWSFEQAVGAVPA